MLGNCLDCPIVGTVKIQPSNSAGPQGVHQLRRPGPHGGSIGLAWFCSAKLTRNVLPRARGLGDTERVISGHTVVVLFGRLSPAYQRILSWCSLGQHSNLQHC
jgi:hypothetical protein